MIPSGLAIVHKLIAQADVLVENFISGKLAEMGLGWEDCKKINPRLVYASITGYGQTGPYAKAAGYDVIIEGEAGFMHMFVVSCLSSLCSMLELTGHVTL